MALQIATNPDTGASVALVGNEWQPIEQTAVNPAGAKAYLIGNQWLLGETVAPPPTAAPTALAAAPAKLTPQRIEQDIVGAAAPEPTATAKLTPQQMEQDIVEAAVQRNQFAPGEEFKKGVIKAATVDLPSMWEQAGVLKDAGAAFTVQNRLDLFDKIDQGEIANYDQLRGLDLTTSQARSYLAASPEVRQKLRGRLDKELGSRKEFIDASRKTLAAYREQAKKYKGRVEDFTDVETTADFTNWLASQVGSGVVQLAPIMLAAATTGGAGVLAVSAVMGTAEATGNRLEFIGKKIAKLPPEEQSKAVVDYLQKTGDVNLAVGIVSGALDVIAGPAAALIKAAAKKVATELTRKAAVKQAVKEVPKQVGEEFITGGLQETAQQTGAIRLEEQKRLNAKKIFNAAMAEAAGSLGGAGVNVAVAGARAPKTNDQVTPARDTIVSRLAELTEIGKGTPEKTVANPDGTTTIVPATEGRAFTPVELVEYKVLTAELTPKPPAPKVDTDIYGRTEPPDLEPSTPATEAARDRTARISAEADRLRTYRGYSTEKSQQLATEKIDEQIKAESAKLAVVIPEGRVEEIAQDLIAAGTPPNEARIEARQLAQEEAESDAEAQWVSPTTKEVEPTLEGAPSATRPITEPDRTGADLSGQPSTDVPAAEGAAGTESSGVVSARPDAAVAATGEGLTFRTVDEILARTKTLEEFNAEIERLKAPPTTTPTETPAVTETEKKPSTLYKEVADASGKTVAFKPSEDEPWRFTAGAVGQVVTFTDSFTNKTHTGVITKIVERTGGAGKSERLNITDNDPTSGFDENGNIVPVKWVLSNGSIQDVNASPTTPTKTPTVTETKPETRGRKAVVKTEEQVTADKAGKAHVARTNRAFEAASSRLTSTGQGERNQAIKSLLRLQREVHKGSALGKRITAALETTNEADRARAQLEFDAQNKKPLASAAATVVNVGPVDAKFSGATNGTQAVTIIAKTGNAFLRFVANRLRPYLAGVKFTVIEEGDELPAILQKPHNKVVWENARGLFVSDPRTGERMVFVRGASFGAAQGVNNITVIHELIHAATNKRISLGNFAISIGQQDSKLQGFMRELNALKNRAEAEFERQLGRGKVSPELEALIMGTGDLNAEGDIEFSIFSSPDEFVAYGMSDPVFQKFLNTIEGKRKDESGFSAFTNNIRDLLGMGKTEATAFSDLIDITDKVLDTALTPAMRETAQSRKDALAPKEKPLAQSLPPDFDEAQARAEDEGTKTALRTQKEKEAIVTHALNVIAKSVKAEDISKQTEILQQIRGLNVLPLLKEAAAGFSLIQKRAIAVIFPTPLVAEIGGINVPELNNTNTLLEKMEAAQNQKMAAGAKMVDNLARLMPTESSKNSVFTAITAATIARIDPRTDRTESRLNSLYDALTPNEKKAYAEVFDYYDDMANELAAILAANVDALMPADADKLKAAMREVLGKDNRIRPYAPLSRDQNGEYWLQIGEGKTAETYTRKSNRERNRLARELAKQRGIPLRQLIEDKEFRMGNTLEDLRAKMVASNDVLRGLFIMIDNADFGAVEAGGSLQQAKDGMKESVFQLWLHMQPENSARKQFIRRKEFPPAGFRTDILQNISESVLKLSNHITKLEYAPKLHASITQAKKSIAETPEHSPYVEEMAKRVDSTLAPMRKSLLNSAAQFANAFAFASFMSESTAILQLVGVVQVASAQLVKRHSVAAVAKELGKLTAIWKTTGVRDKEGNWVAPTIKEAYGMEAAQGDSPETKLRKEEDRFAVEAMSDLNIAESTAAADLLGYANVSAKSKTSLVVNPIALGQFIVSGLIHNAERLSREGVYIASFHLNRDAGLAKLRNTAAYKMTADKFAAERILSEKSRNAWVAQAAKDVKQALFDYSKSAKPRYMRNPVGTAAFQFFTYNLNMAGFILRNLIGIIKPLPGDTRTECLRAFSTLMATTLMTGGLRGTFGVPLIVGFIAAAMKARKDPDEPEEFKDLNSMEAFMKWIHDQLGEVTLGGKPLASVITEGPTNAFTGLDFGSRTSLSNILIPPETRTSRTYQEWYTPTREGIMGYAQLVGGPSLQAILSIADGAKLFADGDHFRGIEKMMPSAFIRNKMTAYRYATEGETGKLGDQIVDAKQFHMGELIGQSIGLRPVLVTDITKANGAATKIITKIVNERTAMLDRIDRADRGTDLNASVTTREAKDEFNKKYSLVAPALKITNDDVLAFKEERNKHRSKSFAGIVYKPATDYIASELTEVPRKALVNRETETQRKYEMEIKGHGK